MKRMLAIATAALMGAGCAQVDAGNLGIVTKWGEIQDEPLPEGLYGITPVRTRVINLSTRVQKREAEATASSKDLQVVTTTIALNYHLDPVKVVEVFRSVGTLRDVVVTIIDPALQEAVKKSTAQYTAEQLITKRQEVKEAITANVEQTLSKSNVVVTEVSITDFKFDDKYQSAVEQKQVAEQKALTARNDLSRIKVEAEQAEAKARGEAQAALARAEAEATAQKMLRETITDEIVQLRAIEAQMAAVAKWDGKQPLVVGASDGTLLDITALQNK